ncbi:golgin subfamily A member 6-like protein 7 [Herpailurus yagouaroundi]|uniref:golgin subfamily A member 6-like protein 7 n=1 Tax=Herpailurus yagouaroundi TaxID=1608482 RepID=UPI001AD6A1CC|nr:golgin subfamily A member 6-like protein 7 [Puma yagouaroundi]XP_040326833.1 golgin subfamily A member 6-like protein 7 [Puma yagouaroundi]
MVVAVPDLGYGAVPTEQPPQNDEELWKKYMSLVQMKKELEGSCMKKDELLHEAQEALAEEQAKRETAEKEKRLLEKRCKMLQQKLETLETIFQESMGQMREEIKRERKNLLRGQNERIQRLEAQIKIMTGNKQHTETDCTPKIMENDDREDTSRPSWWPQICELLQELILLMVKFFSCI